MEFLGEYRYHRLYEISSGAREISGENGNHFVRNYVVVFAPETAGKAKNGSVKEWGIFETVTDARRAIDAKLEKTLRENQIQFENSERILREQNSKARTRQWGTKNKNGAPR